MEIVDILATGKLMPVVTENLPEMFRLHDLTTAVDPDAFIVKVRGLIGE